MKRRNKKLCNTKEDELDFFNKCNLSNDFCNQLGIGCAKNYKSLENPLIDNKVYLDDDKECEQLCRKITKNLKRLLERLDE